MIIKAIGTLLTVAAAWLYGYYTAEYSRKRIEELENFKRGFALFGSETLYAGGMLCEVFKSVAERTGGTAKAVFETAAAMLYEKAAEGAGAVWEICLEDKTKNSFLAEEDIKSLLAFGRCLGFADRQCQGANADMAVEYINTKQEELRKKYLTEAKLYRSLGVLTGLLAAVVIF